MTPVTKNPSFMLAAVVITSVALSACTSSDSNSGSPFDDSPGVSGTDSPDAGDMPSENAGGGAGDGTGTGTGATDGDSGDGTGTGATDGDSGEGGGLSGVGSQALNFGLLQIEQEPDDQDGGSVNGSFFRLNLPITAQQFVSASMPPLDTCSLTRGEQSDIDVPGMGEFDLDLTFIDAGDALVLSSPAGTWLTLMRQEQFGFLIYRPELERLPLPVPANLVLDIPGAEFPAFSNVPVPNVTQLTGVVTEGSDTFRWNAGAGDPSVHIDIELVFFDANSQSVFVACSARDDGVFILPADIQAELGASIPTFTTLSRVGMTAVQSNDSVLFVSNSSMSNR